jgi:hypothetical protein
MEQNYFQFNQDYYKQIDGLAMGAPTSSILAEFYVQNMEHTKINIQFLIYWKPTKTDIIIPNSSCHPYEHKMSSINYLINRMHTYPITKIAKETEKNTIKHILHNNKYDKRVQLRNPPI